MSKSKEEMERNVPLLPLGLAYVQPPLRDGRDDASLLLVNARSHRYLLHPDLYLVILPAATRGLSLKLLTLPVVSSSCSWSL